MRSLATSLILSSVIFVGCVTLNRPSHFYGIEMDSVSRARDFEILSYTDKGVRFNCDHDYMNTDISAWAEVNWAGLQITIVNNSDRPIQTNYFTDDFTLIAKDGKEYKLGKSLQTYYSGDYINPDKSADYYLSTPFDSFSTNTKRLKEETAMIICNIGAFLDRVIIVLKPLPLEEQ